jgi:CRP-like cAMP-binding protein
MYFIASGAVEVQREDGEIRLGTGEFFGEMALILRRPRMADVVALGYCRLLVLPREAFRNFLKSHPDLMQQVRRSAEERLRLRQTERVPAPA